MGERKVPECDIFKTLQPKGLRILQVTLAEMVPAVPVEGNPKWEVAHGSPIVNTIVHVGARGAKRVQRLVEAATNPPKTREAKGDAKQGE